MSMPVPLQDCLWLLLLIVGTILNLIPFSAGGGIYMAFGGSGGYLAAKDVLEFHSVAYNESCDYTRGDLFDIALPSPKEFDGSFFQAFGGLPLCIGLCQVAALGFALALAPKFPLPNRSQWKENNPDTLGVEGLCLQDFDSCRKAVLCAADLFCTPGPKVNPFRVLSPNQLNKYIWHDDASTPSWIASWKQETGQSLDDQTVESMRKVFRYLKKSMQQRQKIVLNMQLAHGLFVVQQINAVMQLVQNAYRSNRLFWHHVVAFSFSDAMMLAAYPPKLFTTIVFYARVVTGASLANNFFRESSVLACSLTAVAAQGSVLLYLIVTPPDLLAILLMSLINSSVAGLYSRLEKRKVISKDVQSFVGVALVMIVVSTFWMIPHATYGLVRWLFVSSAMPSTAMLYMCNMDHVLFWDLRGQDFPEVANTLVSSLDQNIAVVCLMAFCVVCLAFARQLLSRCCWRGRTQGSAWTHFFGIQPGTILKVWCLQPEFHGTGFHFNDRAESVAPILGTSWWLHTLGVFNTSLEKYYLHHQKTFYARRRVWALYGMWSIRHDERKQKTRRSLLQLRQAIKSTQDMLQCLGCQAELCQEQLSKDIRLVRHVPCGVCFEPLVQEGAAGNHTINQVWTCSSDTCTNFVVLCNRCVAQAKTGDMTPTYQRMVELEDESRCSELSSIRDGSEGMPECGASSGLFDDGSTLQQSAPGEDPSCDSYVIPVDDAKGPETAAGVPPRKSKLKRKKLKPSSKKKSPFTFNIGSHDPL